MGRVASSEASCSRVKVSSDATALGLGVNGVRAAGFRGFGVLWFGGLGIRGFGLGVSGLRAQGLRVAFYGGYRIQGVKV